MRNNISKNISKQNKYFKLFSSRLSTKVNKLYCQIKKQAHDLIFAKILLLNKNNILIFRNENLCNSILNIINNKTYTL